MKRILGILAALAAVSVLVWVILESREGRYSSYASQPETPVPQQSAGASFTYNFDSDAVGAMPAKFHSARTGQGAESKWVVVADSTAPSKPNVVAQTSTDTTDYRFPLLIADEGSFKDLEISVRFKAVSGKVDRAGGLVFRLKDANNYYIVRANGLEDNYRLYHVVAGRRRQFAGANFKVTSGEWHELRVKCVGNKFLCYYDGAKKIEATDDTFKDGGKVGLWTKADSVTYFDDLAIKELSDSASASPVKKIYAQELVDELAVKYPNLLRIGMHVTPPNKPDNLIIACTVAERIGQKSDPEDLKAMNTGQPVVLKEGENFDVTLPLHDAAGKIIGAVGLTFKPRLDEHEPEATRRARAMAQEIEKHIPSTSQLFETRSQS